MIKDKIVLFFDALLELFDGTNKIIYRKIFTYRHEFKNVMSEDGLVKALTLFFSCPINFTNITNHAFTTWCELPNHKNCILHEHVNDSCVQSKEIFNDFATLLNACSIENKKIIWKWIDHINSGLL